MPSQDTDLVATAQELRDEPAADVAGRSGDEQTHSVSVAQPPGRRIPTHMGVGGSSGMPRTAFVGWLIMLLAAITR